MEVKLSEMTQADRFRIGHKQALKIYEEWKAEAQYAGEVVSGVAMKVGV